MDDDDAEPDLESAWGDTQHTGSVAKLARILRLRKEVVQTRLKGFEAHVFSGERIVRLFHDNGGMQDYKRRVAESMKRAKKTLLKKATPVLTPDEFEWAQCPIAMTLMKNPMFIPICGHTFDEKSLSRLPYHRETNPVTGMSQNISKCPKCRLPFKKGSVKINYALKDAIIWMKKLPPKCFRE